MSGWGGRSEGSSCGTSWTRWGELFLLENFTGHWELGIGVEHTSLTLEPWIIHDNGIDTYEDGVVHRPQPESGFSALLHSGQLVSARMTLRPMTQISSSS
jgi:hypothetical protein